MNVARNVEKRRRFAALAVTMIAPILFGACGSHEIDAADFDQSCTKDADCVAVFTGEVDCCYFSECEKYDAAINVSALSAYNAEEEADTESCQASCITIACVTSAACVAGKCAVAPTK